MGALLQYFAFSPAHAPQIFPEWCIEMEGAVSKTDYDALMKDLKDHFDGHAGSVEDIVSRNTWLPDFCRFSRFESGMNAVLARHAQRFRGGIFIKRTTELDAQFVHEVPEEKAVDQYGKVLVSTLGKRGRGSREWPPVGYNVIMAVAQGMAAGEWPPGAAPARNRGGAVPAQLTTPVSSHRMY